MGTLNVPQDDAHEAWEKTGAFFLGGREEGAWERMTFPIHFHQRNPVDPPWHGMSLNFVFLAYSNHRQLNSRSAAATS